jgi:glycosyltransferase involved in cell wall biosynthesis
MSQNHPPAVSVITPLYNRADYIPQIVTTLGRQTFADFELIIVDDGSNDDPLLAIENVKAEFPIRLIRHERNAGAASARNSGIDVARGRYVAFLDSDDAWTPEKLLQQLQHVEKSHEAGPLVSLTRQLVVGPRTYVAPRRLLTRDQAVGEYLFQCGGIIQSSMMFMDTGLAKSVRFVDGGRGHDDWSFALRLEEAGARFEMLPAALTIYNDDRGRARRSPSYSKARFDWLEQWRERLGEGPYLAARAAFASQMTGDRSPQLFRAIWTALLRRAIPAWRAAYYAVTLAFPAVRSYSVLTKEAWLSRGLGAVNLRHEWKTPEKKHPCSSSVHSG